MKAIAYATVLSALVLLGGCNKDSADRPAAPPEDPLGDCTGDKAGACLSAGVKLQNGEGVAKDVPAALGMFRKVCDGGDVKGCTLAAHLFKRGEDGVEQDEPQALMLYEKACAADEPNACFHAGNAYGIEQLGARKDPKKSYAYLKKACDLGGKEDACNFAEMVKGTLDRMPEVLAPKCEAGDGAACMGLGMASEKAQPPDAKAAVAAYEKACTLGSHTGCARASKLLFDGKNGVESDHQRSHDLASQACDAGIANSCFLMAVFYRRGYAVQADPVRSRDYLTKACDGGVESACKFLKEGK